MISVIGYKKELDNRKIAPGILQVARHAMKTCYDGHHCLVPFRHFLKK